MSRIAQVQLEELEKMILSLDEYDKLEITYKLGKVKVVKKLTKQLIININ